jgi:NAD(P)-dependent dehydrogenase (short-subunit alcohol dehydrogenase family)
MPLFNLRGKVAIVTGSSRGIGRAIAEALATQSASVLISSRKPPACEAAADAINTARGAGLSSISSNGLSRESGETPLVGSRAALARHWR